VSLFPTHTGLHTDILVLPETNSMRLSYDLLECYYNLYKALFLPPCLFTLLYKFFSLSLSQTHTGLYTNILVLCFVFFFVVLLFFYVELRYILCILDVQWLCFTIR